MAFAIQRYAGSWEKLSLERKLLDLEQIDLSDASEERDAPDEPKEPNARSGAEGPANEGVNTPPPREWFEVLGVPRHASVEVIKAAWRDKIKQYHPDRVADLGPEFVEIADRVTKDLNSAYEEGLRQSSHG